MEKRKWFRDAKIRLIATIAAGISAIVAAGVFFDWRTALGILVAEVVACVAYSLRKWLKKKKGAKNDIYYPKS